ncbi:putative ubiquitin conjugating enzyme [Cladophialophora carrionii]|uniref:Putative ubiquitin conjugating enzyme n=1 Tax=Cladophialophora carrionii TaxID=86049 RepID=A0A1C1CFA7_9EURO|nr:putative ubiquitin conjugating enzyme [Cladophialophora carrionii]
MGRKLFLSHLADAGRLGSKHIHGVRSPEEGIVIFTYVYPTSPFHDVDIQAYATDLEEYPDGNSFMLCTQDESAEPVVSTVLQKLSGSANGKSLGSLLSEVSESLTIAISAGAVVDNISQEVKDDADDFDFDFEGDSDNEFFGPVESKPSSSTDVDNMVLDSGVCSEVDAEKVARARADLAALKESGFRVGVFGNPATSGILCVSIRISKLGLSDEALEAWGIPRKRYLTLLIKYSRGYRDSTRVADDKDLTSSVQMRVGLCKHYKPSARHVLGVFQCPTIDSATSTDQAKDTSGDDFAIEPLFVSKALNQLLEERVFKIIYARHLYHLTWLGAEKFIAERQASASSDSVLDLTPYYCDDTAGAQNLPAIVLSDHMLQVPLPQASLPLIVMQFVLRHVVRCTEFCLVCHCPVDDSFEALKPYVCPKPLCLFQYLALGFGPSLEWEILTQPYVVDILVSFCYAAASNSRLKELPVGMNLLVPLIRQYESPDTEVLSYRGYSRKYNPAPQPTSTIPEPSFSGTWDKSTLRLVVDGAQGSTTASVQKIDEEAKNPAAQHAAVKKVKAGDWIAMYSARNAVIAHCRVKSVALPQIALHQPILVSLKPSVTDPEMGPPCVFKTSLYKVDCYLYDKNFDEMATASQQTAILALLDTLPGVNDMRMYLKLHGRTQNHNLKAWTDRISDSALNLLRWIVASNRSCILQVDEICEGESSEILGRPADRVGGMDAWMQFRFAQGAPDKEKRFNDCVKEQAEVSGTEYPTLFAWHGSRIANWHSIIRQGLHYDEIINGRAFGNGIYMSNTAMTSLTYSQHINLAESAGWKSSALKIANVLSLQEVVNNTDKFVCKHPHYVVADIDWVQTRYLFIKTKNVATNVDESVGTVYQQDPARLVYNELGRSISIPITAISKTRRSWSGISSPSRPQEKRPKTVHHTDQASAECRADDDDSVSSDAEDLAFLQEPNDRYDPTSRASLADTAAMEISDNKGHAGPPIDTDFVPGQLDSQSISFMEEPQDATPTATKALMRLLKDALDTQKHTAPATLGWYIDRNLIHNMYQWIVELHSFPGDLGLAQDMKAAGLTSIVMEMRFTSQYPFSPPFIRVVRPRFLPFSQGGGGNVTEGGAMCMEVLTNNGWSASLTIESLLLQVRLVLMDTERPARLAAPSRHGGQSAYGIGEAVAAYIRACEAHGWQVPAGFNTIRQ